MKTLDELLDGTELVTDTEVARRMISALPMVQGSDAVLDLMTGKRRWPLVEMVPRHYHGPRHIGRMWREFSQFGCASAELVRQVARFAVFHDAVVCDGPPGRSEYESALCLSSYGDCDSWLVTTAILMTANHTRYMPWLDWRIKLMLDLDLAELGTDRYAVNGDLIRKEYAHVDNKHFAIGRGLFLTAMLGREKIFYTLDFADREQPARDNMRAELEALDVLLAGMASSDE